MTDAEKPFRCTCRKCGEDYDAKCEDSTLCPGCRLLVSPAPKGSGPPGRKS